ncbi:MAG: malto-oligosyltrehalose trehalohydrolase [Acidobacteria bacterium]|nr:malto-oligosyltrehalose trehalohydrolase [Acidobacteriota bacterium]
MAESIYRSLPGGANLAPGGAHFRVWAPERRRVEVVLEGRDVPLDREPDGHFSGFVPCVAEGALYKCRLDGGEAYPDPYSRFQPMGPHHASMVVDPSRFEWTDSGWRGLSRKGQVLYELHIGTFTREGTWAAAAGKLAFLRDLGVTAVEAMPVSEFPGAFGWGYDGVHHFAPTRLYGPPDDFRRFVDQAHSLGLGVILDVVYNHFGPDGNYLAQFSPGYFTDRHHTDWGAAIEYASTGARELAISNAAYWIREFHLDGLRLDATQNIYDDTGDHVIAALTRAAREAAGERGVLIIAENDSQDARLLRAPERGGYGVDMVWNDDFHHSAMVALSGHNIGYYSDYSGTPQEFVSAAKYGFLHQGQWRKWRRKRLGTPAFDIEPAAFVTYTEDHDQVANSGRGLRVHQHSEPGSFRALTALMLLGPGTPMLFQGQEFGATAPFLYFVDHHDELGRQVREGRNRFLSQFATATTPEMQSHLPDPCDRATFERSILDWREAERNQDVIDLHRDLIRLRREDPVFRSQRHRGLDGAVLSEYAFLLRFFGDDGDDRLLIVNLGRDLNLTPGPEPLLAPPAGRLWTPLWSSENPKYGGCGSMPPETEQNWWVAGRSALALAPV